MSTSLVFGHLFAYSSRSSRNKHVHWLRIQCLREHHANENENQRNTTLKQCDEKSRVWKLRGGDVNRWEKRDPASIYGSALWRLALHIQWFGDIPHPEEMGTGAWVSVSPTETSNWSHGYWLNCFGLLSLAYRKLLEVMSRCFTLIECSVVASPGLYLVHSAWPGSQSRGRTRIWFKLGERTCA